MTQSSLIDQPKANTSLFDDDQTIAERLLLDLADYVYGHTSLKPMSKTLFVVSRCLLVAGERSDFANITDVANAYEGVRKRLGHAAPEDDYSLDVVLRECADHIGLIMERLSEVRRLTRGTDCMGLAFNALLRGKIEGGEGLGTFLTPEEVVEPMVDMAFATLANADLGEQFKDGCLFGDICGGTGRFVFAMSREFAQRGVPIPILEKAARLYDQSRLAVDLARINFVLQGQTPNFRSVSDSLVDQDVASESGKYLLLATNPPFGSGKYRLAANQLQWLSPALLQIVAATGRIGAVDPAILFLIRNLDLLKPGGVLAIVLPDGIARNAVLPNLLREYEKSHRCGIDIAATVSLPSVTFALGGTVAKTSFVILRKVTSSRRWPTFAATARHIGFLKRGNRRTADPHGNDLVRIAADYGAAKDGVTDQARDWRLVGHEQKHADLLDSSETPLGETVADLATAVRQRAGEAPIGGPAFHISILDVDATGLIDVISAQSNQPVSRGIACQPGDVLLSCINPSHWRVAVVPKLNGDWSCSPEFLVLRPKGATPLAGWALAIRLHHREVIDAVRQKASGTSSSRQRVEKGPILDEVLPKVTYEIADLKKHHDARLTYYQRRIEEAAAYQRLHEGDSRFGY